MENAALERLVHEPTDALFGSMPVQTAPMSAHGGRSLMTPLGLASGDVLTEIDWAGTMTLRQLIRKLDWPVHLVMMAVGSLVRQGLVRATQRELEVLVEPMPEWSRGIPTAA